MVEDFSLTQLIGAVAQLVAIGAAFWALIGTISPGEYSLPATRWLAAIFCQLLALTFFLLHRQR